MIHLRPHTNPELCPNVAMQQTHEKGKDGTAARQRPTLAMSWRNTIWCEVIEWLYRLRSGVDDSPHENDSPQPHEDHSPHENYSPHENVSPHANDSLSVVQRACRMYAERAGFRKMAGCYLFLLVCPTPCAPPPHPNPACQGLLI